jgi:hypothetical protein
MTEFPLAFWLEKEGYDVTCISNIDTHTDADGLMRAKVFCRSTTTSTGRNGCSRT